MYYITNKIRLFFCLSPLVIYQLSQGCVKCVMKKRKINVNFNKTPKGQLQDSYVQTSLRENIETNEKEINMKKKGFISQKINNWFKELFFLTTHHSKH